MAWVRWVNQPEMPKRRVSMPGDLNPSLPPLSIRQSDSDKIACRVSPGIEPKTAVRESRIIAQSHRIHLPGGIQDGSIYFRHGRQHLSHSSFLTKRIRSDIWSGPGFVFFFISSHFEFQGDWFCIWNCWHIFWNFSQWLWLTDSAPTRLFIYQLKCVMVWIGLDRSRIRILLCIISFWIFSEIDFAF